MRKLLIIVLLFISIIGNTQEHYFGTYNQKMPVAYCDVDFECENSTARFKIDTNGGYSIRKFGIRFSGSSIYPFTVFYDFHPIVNHDYYFNVGVFPDSVTVFYTPIYVLSSGDSIIGSGGQMITPVCEGNAPSVTTCQPPYTKTQTTVTICGQVTDEGSSSLIDYGICYSTSPNPTRYSNIAPRDATPFIGYNGYLSGLTAGTTYYVRAFAYNAVGTGYGTEYSFTTEQSDCYYTPITTTNDVANFCPNFSMWRYYFSSFSSLISTIDCSTPSQIEIVSIDGDYDGDGYSGFTLSKSVPFTFTPSGSDFSNYLDYTKSNGSNVCNKSFTNADVAAISFRIKNTDNVWGEVVTMYAKVYNGSL